LLCNKERLKTVSFPRKQITGLYERKGLFPEWFKCTATQCNSEVQLVNVPPILKLGGNCTSLAIGKKYAATTNGTSSCKKRQCLN